MKDALYIQHEILTGEFSDVQIARMFGITVADVQRYRDEMIDAEEELDPPEDEYVLTDADLEDMQKYYEKDYEYDC